LVVFPGQITGISIDACLSTAHKRDWLTEADAGVLKDLMVQSAIPASAFPARVSRAFWYYEYAIRTYYADLRWTLICTALEALVHTGKHDSTRHFRKRVPLLASEASALAKSDPVMLG